MQNSPFCEVGIQVLISSDLPAQIPNGSLKSPLSIAGQRTHLNSLRSDMGEHMNALPDKVDARLFVLVINLLEFAHKVHQHLMAFEHFFMGDTMPLEEAHA